MKAFMFVVLVALIAYAWADERCTDGQTKIADDGCNRCRCGNGLWLCTQMACPSHHQHRRAAACTQGEEKKERCNMCRCTETGVFACTRRACPPEAPSRRRRNTPNNCTPGAKFMDKCNQCTCRADGRSAACTYRLC